MIKKVTLLFSVVAFVAALMVSCMDPMDDTSVDGNKQEEQLDDLKPLKATTPVSENWVFEGKPKLLVRIENPNGVKVEAKVVVKITKDIKQAVATITKTFEIAANKTTEVTITTDEDLPAGFYSATSYVNNKAVSSFVFGVSPFEVVSEPDKQSDFDAYWEETKNQLKAVDMNPRLTEITSKSSAKRKVYLVEMNSIQDGLTGEPVVVRGYYLEPQDGQKHPVIMHFFGYDDINGASKAYCPDGGASDYAEFYLSTRGQVVNNRTADKREPDGKGDFTNVYGDWFAYSFGNLESYYYRGAFMDCVQAVRFMATRTTSDMTKLFAEGSSQGGALSYAAAALSDYPFTAIAPCVAFLGDFPDYFKIVSWPGDTAKANKGSMTDEQMYAFLSYFDTKNLATRLGDCAVIACTGLQDKTCPPHTNIAPYNNLPTTDKEYYFYPEMKHDIPSDWAGKYMKFFKERM